MIISASYKTDIPTFYGEWFVNRLRAGYCKTVNPFNKIVGRVSLKRSDVGAIVKSCVLRKFLSGGFLQDSVLEGTSFDDEGDLFVAA